MNSLWRSLTRSPRVLPIVAALVVVGVLTGLVGTATAQTGDPVLFDVTPPTQTTAPGTTVDVTFTVSDVPPCDDANLVTLDSLDFTVTGGQSTIASFTTSEPGGSYGASFSPDATSLSILFDEGLPCENSPGPPPAETESITVVVTVNVPAGVPSGTQVTLTGDARGFSTPPDDEYLLQRTATVLVQIPPPVTFGMSPPA
jgi:hypothetical protein